MVSSQAQTVKDYLAELPEDRRAAVQAVRKVIKKNLAKGIEETMQYGMLSYSIPLSRYPDTYNKQPLSVVSLASQKNYMSLYLMCIYSDADLEARFAAAYAASGKKLNMGKSCVRFKRLEDLPLEVVAEVISEVTVEGFIASYESVHGDRSKAPAKKAVAKKAPAKKAVAKKAPAKKAPAKKVPAKKAPRG